MNIIKFIMAFVAISSMGFASAESVKITKKSPIELCAEGHGQYMTGSFSMMNGQDGELVFVLENGLVLPIMFLGMEPPRLNIKVKACVQGQIGVNLFTSAIDVEVL